VLVCVLMKSLQELLTNRSVNQQASPGETNLPAIVVLASRLLGSKVKVSIGKHDERAFAAQLGREGYKVTSGGNPDQ
jgi:hypothetical protein